MPRIPFKIRKDGSPIREAGLPFLKGQLNITASPLAIGVVPLYEEHCARRDAGYTLPEWRELSPIDRAYEVAVRRIGNLIDAYHAEENQKRMK